MKIYIDEYRRLVWDPLAFVYVIVQLLPEERRFP